MIALPINPRVVNSPQLKCEKPQEVANKHPFGTKKFKKAFDKCALIDHIEDVMVDIGDALTFSIERDLFRVFFKKSFGMISLCNVWRGTWENWSFQNVS